MVKERPSDLVELALRRYPAITRAFRFGGYGRDYRVAEQALAEYLRRREDAEPKQLSFLRGADDR